MLLKTRYPGKLIPSIPAKLVTPPTTSVAQTRTRLFRQFLNRLGGDEILRNDAAVRAFLETTNQAAWWVVKPNAFSSSGA